jgi:putative phage-type endonuclease
LDKLQWLRDRQNGVGASDAPVLLGLGYGDRTPADLYRAKTGAVDLSPSTGRLLRGLELEEIVARKYAEATGNSLAPPEDAIVRHPARQWQFASLDRVIDKVHPLELKTCEGFGDEWGDPFTDSVPDRYWVQVQHQMGVFGAARADLAALNVRDWEFRIYRIAFNRAFFELLTEAESEFWERVQVRSEPASDWEPARAAQLRTAAAKILPGEAIDLGERGRELAQARRLWADRRDEAEQQYRRMTDELTALMGEAEIGTAEGWQFKRRFVAPTSFTVNRKGYTQLDVRAPKGQKGRVA